MVKLIILGAIIVLNTSACTPFVNHKESSEDKITLGLAQSKLRNGMSGDDVVSVMGSPNIVTQQADKSEVWVYDKNYSESRSSGGLFSSSTSNSQKNFIVTIIFDKNKRVKDITYRQSSY